MSAQPILRPGNVGAAVRLLQTRLVAKGFPVDIDGTYGPKTQVAVDQFQASCGLDVDGIVGAITWSFLMSTGQAPTPEDVLKEQRGWLLDQIPWITDGKVRAVLEVMIDHLGCREVPDGSNGGSEIADLVDVNEDGSVGDGKPPSAYYEHWGIQDPTLLATMPPWCAIALGSAMRIGLGKTSWKDIPLGDWLGGAQQIEDWAKRNLHWKNPGDALIPAGAIFTISRSNSSSDPSSSPNAGHVGFIVCDNGDGTVTTVEGNVSNQVGSHKRTKTSLRGYVTWWS